MNTSIFRTPTHEKKKITISHIAPKRKNENRRPQLEREIGRSEVGRQGQVTPPSPGPMLGGGAATWAD